MSISPITLVQATQLPNAIAVQYTCPVNSKVVIRHVVFTNTTAGAITVTAEIVPSGGSTGDSATILKAFSIAANTAYVSAELAGCVLNTGDTLQCFASAATSISMNASGILNN